MLRPILASLTLAVAVAPAVSSDEASYRKEIEEYRAERQERLRAERGWLSVSGLFWLERGENTIGSDPASRVVLPSGLPAIAGKLTYDGESVRIEAAHGVEIQIDGEPVTGQALRDDGDENPDVVTIGRISFQIVERQDRHGVRVRDPENPARKEFGGIDFFPVDPGYRLRAKFRPFDEPRRVTIPTVIGTEIELLAPGSVEFSVAGRQRSLLPLVGDPADRNFWFIFRDATSGKETYGAGRYLYADLEEDGTVSIDFNRAYNPPCAFTPHATCPLPPHENRLDVPIRAGEKSYAH